MLIGLRIDYQFLVKFSSRFTGLFYWGLFHYNSSCLIVFVNSDIEITCQFEEECLEDRKEAQWVVEGKY